jgi:PAS domain S-box-containing protein
MTWWDRTRPSAHHRRARVHLWSSSILARRSPHRISPLHSSPKKKILIVDDETVVPTLLERLSGLGYAVAAIAPSEAEAIATATETGDRFFEIAIDLLCVLGFNGYFSRLNPAWERALGFTRAELMSRPFIEFVHPDDRERTLKQNAAVRSGGKALGFENRYICQDGSCRWFHWNAAPDSGNKVIYSVARDITEAKRAEVEREQLVTELQSALAEVSSLQEILPICSYCKKIRDDENYWHTVESYLSHHAGSQFSHSICPTCMETVVEPELKKSGRG